MVEMCWQQIASARVYCLVDKCGIYKYNSLKISRISTLSGASLIGGGSLYSVEVGIVISLEDISTHCPFIDNDVYHCKLYL